MFNKHWFDECWRFGLGILTALLASFILNAGLWPLVGFLIIYASWMIYRFHELELWLRDGGKLRKAPDAVGIASEIMQLIHRDRKSSGRQKDRLRASLVQFNEMAAELPDATVILDDQMQIRWCNTAASSLLGVSRRNDGGQRIDNLIRYPEFHQFLSDDDAAVELEIPSPVNQEITLSLRIVPGGENLNILTGRDITQRVKIREMRKAFVADVSHELRTPLTVIQGYVEMLLDDESIADSTREPLRQIKGQSDRMTHIVNDLLTLSRLESSVLSGTDGRPILVPGVIETILRDVRSSGECNHNFIADIDPDLHLVGNEKEVFSACQNLIHNAARYATPGTDVEVYWQRRDAHAVFSVRDHGPGIEAQHVPRLSERFYRVDKGRSRETGGTGLGLAIVKYIAQRHGGSLSIDSVLDQGSTFEISFPQERIYLNQ
ncbi:MAG: phosphate regulon sensor histidine kinase PhoR [Gammaproteobacteria bacterium]|nr:phosphate regulon sensor histidine kinase PhoR [Gammaproteobacteria bacterium]